MKMNSSRLAATALALVGVVIVGTVAPYVGSHYGLSGRGLTMLITQLEARRHGSGSRDRRAVSMINSWHVRLKLKQVA